MQCSVAKAEMFVQAIICQFIGLSRFIFTFVILRIDIIRLKQQLANNNDIKTEIKQSLEQLL